MIRFSDIRIRPKFTLLLVCLGIIPMLGATIFTSHLASNALIEQSFQRLETIQSLRRTDIEAFFHKRLTDIDTFVSVERVKDFVQSLHSSQRTSSEARINSDLNFIKTFVKNYQYSDLFILHPENGRILYSLNGRETSANKFRGNNDNSPLFQAWFKAINHQKATFVDFSERDEDQKQSAYFSAPIFDDQANITGIVALEISTKLIAHIVDSRVGMGDTGESYLVGIDPVSNKFELRSDLVTMGDQQYVVGYQFATNLDYWMDAKKFGFKGGENIYIDSASRNVLVRFGQVNVPGYDWYLISKVNEDEVTEPINYLLIAILMASIVLVLVVGLVSLRLSGSVTEPLIAAMNFAQDIAAGKLTANLKLDRKDEIGELGSALNEMAVKLQDIDWMQSGKESLDNELRGDLDLSDLTNRFITFFSNHMDAKLGAFYIFDEEDELLKLKSSYAFTDRNGNFNQLKLGEGMVGQAALEKSVIAYSDVIDNAPILNYGIGEVIPRYFMAIPLLADTHLTGVVLLGASSPFNELKRKFVDEVMNNAAVVFNAAKSRDVIEQLLNQAQMQQEGLSKANKELKEQTDALLESEKALQTQQEELRVTNEELEEQTKILRDSEAILQTQQEELRVTNEELEERTKALEDKTVEMQEKNDELHEAQRIVEEKAKELSIASKYKSEFLANMSHELRTPLNSILILSQLFANNKDGNLTSKQIDSAKAINSSGSDLLSLINEILDLSKVEAGKIDLHIEHVPFSSIQTDIKRLYNDIVDEKGLEFEIDVANNLPNSIETDSQRLQQILRNLLTNAVKFTHSGRVSLNIARPSPEIAMKMNLSQKSLVAFHVKDDGIGIKEEQQQAIFQAFQQADGGTSRKYGGTGLGLSISKELTHLLGGNILLNSKEGKGSTFTVVLPLNYIPQMNKASDSIVGSDTPDSAQLIPREKRQKPSTPETTPKIMLSRSPMDESYVNDDRQSIVAEDKTLLIIEDDRAFASVMRDFGRERGFKCIVAETGETGLHFADHYKPSAIILDIGLPGIDGWTVMERLKENPDLRHIPVHFMSASDSDLDAMRMGAIGYLTKPVDTIKLDRAFSKIEDIISKPVRKLLIIEDDEIQRESIVQLIGQDDIYIKAVSDGKSALAELEAQRYDCMILDLGLEDMTGFELLELIRRSETAARVPIIVYTGQELSLDEEKELNQYAESIIIKGVKSPERLLDESALFLHLVEAKLPDKKRKMLKAAHDKNSVLKDKNVLLVDDDMRNVFALSSVLEDEGMNITIARDGQDSLEKLNENPDINLILMDIMMPIMDGYQAMKKIRENNKYEGIPIIALTAKAMKGDRSKCIEAGASDYLAKPVDTDKLISMMRVWLY